MSLHAAPHDIIPEQTLQVARAACHTGTPSRRRRDALRPLSTNATVAALFSHPGRPAEAPAPRALMTMMPCAEGRAAAQAVAAVRARLAWQDARALELTAPGVDAAVR